MTQLVENGRRTPKVQVERSIGPILGFFLEKAISDLLGREVMTLAPEFPLKKAEDNQSTNIDWLMYDKTRNELLLVELKTENTSFRKEQLTTYLRLVTNEAPWEGIKRDLCRIGKASKSRKKYENTWKELGTKTENFPQIESAVLNVIYLAPESTRGSFKLEIDKFKNDPNSPTLKGSVEFFSFADLDRIAGRDLSGDFAPYRKLLYMKLKGLDRPVTYPPMGLPDCDSLVMRRSA